MKHGRLPKQIWLLPILVAVLVITHAAALYGMFSRMTWTLALGLLVLFMLVHLGAFGSIYAVLKRWFGHKL